uniref:Transthyretin-like family protein n=2 Tax=Caenorhabditis japonica TaxID=281687 RepID=A0A8R1DMZ9_CAEJA
MSIARLAVTLLVLSLAALEVNAYLQNVTVKGTVLCNNKRAPNVHVILYERDMGTIFDPHDKLDRVYTDEEGAFKLYGEENELFEIEPFIKIHHTCNAKPGCEHTSEYVVPKSKIGGTYDMTYVSLQASSDKDEVDCS